MKILTVYAHPDPQSFCAALRDRFVSGLREAGHEVELADLYAEKFNPVFCKSDMAFFADESLPEEELEKMQVRQKVLEQAGGPLRRMVARQWMRRKTSQEIVRMIYGTRSKDVIREQERVLRADALAFIAPVYWLGFPAILKGWVERVFTYGFAYKLTASGMQGDIHGRIPLLRQQKALLMSTTFFKQADYNRGLRQAMETVVDTWGFRYPGIKHVEHEYFWAVPSVDDGTRKQYLARAQELGRDFAVGLTAESELGSATLQAEDSQCLSR
jgi:NAD(P)H dehydrogenase (quinone)